MIFWRGEGSRRAGAGLRFAEEWAAEEILDQVGSRLAAGRGLLDIKICMPTRQGIVCGRLKASRSRRRVTACTARRRGLPFAPAKGSKRVFKPNLRSPVGVAENMQGAKPVRLAAGAFLLCVRVVAGCAPCRVTPLTLGVTLQRSAAPPFPSGPRVPPGAPYQNTLGAAPQDPDASEPPARKAKATASRGGIRRRL